MYFQNVYYLKGIETHIKKNRILKSKCNSHAYNGELNNLSIVSTGKIKLLKHFCNVNLTATFSVTSFSQVC